MGMKVSYGIDSEVTEEELVWGVASVSEVNIAQTSHATRESVIEGHLLLDYVHVLISTPPKYEVAHVVGYLKGKSAIHIARIYMVRYKNFTGQNF